MKRNWLIIGLTTNHIDYKMFTNSLENVKFDENTGAYVILFGPTFGNYAKNHFPNKIVF